MSFNEDRKLPTFRFDEHRAEDAERLPVVTAQRYRAFLDTHADEYDRLPPSGIIHSVVKLNSHKRQKAFLRAIEESDGVFPPETIVSSIMNHGGPIPGVNDHYLEADYASHEVFAYNRLGKQSMLNRKFGEKCIEAMQYAYPDSTQLGQFENLRARVHRIITTPDERLAVVSTKETIDRREQHGRTSLLVSRVTGVARFEHDAIDQTTRQAIETLAAHECDTSRLLGAKALLTEFTLAHDDTDAIVPVIQTMYQTQH